MKQYTDEELALKAQAGNKDAECELVQRYWRKSEIIACSVVIPGVEVDDKHSECLVALVNAVRGWEKDKGTIFRTFAKLAMSRKLIDLYRASAQVSAIPACAIRSLDEAVNTDG